MKSNFKLLNTKEFKYVTEKVSQERSDLIDIQQEMARGYSDHLRIMDKDAMLRLEKWSLIEEKILQQNFRAH